MNHLRIGQARLVGQSAGSLHVKPTLRTSRAQSLAVMELELYLAWTSVRGKGAAGKAGPQSRGGGPCPYGGVNQVRVAAVRRPRDRVRGHSFLSLSFLSVLKPTPPIRKAFSSPTPIPSL
jgi:hypothetical protein